MKGVIITSFSVMLQGEDKVISTIKNINGSAQTFLGRYSACVHCLSQGGGEALRGFPLDLMVVDEAHRLKNGEVRMHFHCPYN